jgi:hypothetical protein
MDAHVLDAAKQEMSNTIGKIVNVSALVKHNTIGMGLSVKNEKRLHKLKKK